MGRPRVLRPQLRRDSLGGGVPMTVVGWFLIGAAVYFAVRMHRLDRRMQEFRPQGASQASYTLVPLRWRQELYIGEGQQLVRQAWLSWSAMALCFVIGAVLVAVPW